MVPDPDALLLAVASLVDRLALAKTLLTDPRDRLYHAADGTWWKRDHNLIIAADAPDLAQNREETAKSGGGGLDSAPQSG